MRRVLIVAFALGLAACSGGPKPVADPAVKVSGKTAARAPALEPTAPLVKMASGTDAVDGVLAVWCEAKKCRRAAGARPLRYIAGMGNGLLLFEASAAPASALIEFRGARGKLVHRRVLDPGTTMAYSGDGLSRGYYRVVLIASWPKREGRWVFGLKGPLGAA